MHLGVDARSVPGAGSSTARRSPLICPSNRGAIDPTYFPAPGRRPLPALEERADRAYTKAQIWITPLSARRDCALIGRSRLLLPGAGPVGVADHREPVDDRLPRPLVPLLLGRLLRRQRLRHRLRRSARRHVGPCTRASTAPLLATGGRVSGPGRGDARFYDAARRLRLAYAAWDYGHTGYPKTTSCLRTAVRLPPAQAARRDPRRERRSGCAARDVGGDQPWLGARLAARLALLVGALLAVDATSAVRSGPARPGRQRPVPAPGSPTAATSRTRRCWRVGSRFYAASTTVAALSLPVTTSTDLRTWTAAAASDPDKPAPNDAMPNPAALGRHQHAPAGGRTWAATWAPSVARIVTGAPATLRRGVLRAARQRRHALRLARAQPLAAGAVRRPERGPLTCGAVRRRSTRRSSSTGGAVWLLLQGRGRARPDPACGG